MLTSQAYIITSRLWVTLLSTYSSENLLCATTDPTLKGFGRHQHSKKEPSTVLKTVHRSADNLLVPHLLFDPTKVLS
ncbi:hypothetical protein CEXT_562721 [Caerostris extrusa]|uniref:Secreted protein n=1 Tax=Caerostris extrusa TaxID=172846 RepID=A0AAV4WN09_CAEEX|nr:hypothetical protein CEXT_562721 [Caerostris extrusa]